MSQNLYSIPNMLSYFRGAVIPVIMLLFFFDNAFAVWLNVVLFALAGISDYLDGYIARRTGQTTLYGKLLDYSTDKMVVCAALILLVGFDRLTGLWLVPVILIIVREIAIGGVREFMAIHAAVAPVSKLGKWKTTMQMVAIGFLIAGPYGEMLIPHAFVIGKILLLAATVMTVISGWDYALGAFRAMRKLDAEKT